MSKTSGMRNLLPARCSTAIGDRPSHTRGKTGDVLSAVNSDDVIPRSNHEFLVETYSTSSDSDFSITSATSRALTNISKNKHQRSDVTESRSDVTKRLVTFPEWRKSDATNKRRHIADSNVDINSESDKTCAVESEISRKKHQRLTIVTVNTTEPAWNTVIDSTFIANKDSLYNLSSNSLVPQSPAVLQLQAIRNSLVNYGISRDIYIERYDFVSLLTTLLLLCGKALHCILHVNLALLPLFEIFMHVASFFFQQLQVISRHNGQDKVKASLVCAVHTTSLLLVTVFIYGSVLIPVFMIGMSIFWKIGYFLLI